MNYQFLSNLGLSDFEIEIYLNCLKNGKVPASLIAKRCNVKRTSVYPVLDKLIDEGYLSFSKIKGVKYFLAIDPELIIKKYENFAQDINDSLPIAREELKKLNRLKRSSMVVNTEFFEGKEGVINIFNQFIKEVPPKAVVLNYIDLLFEEYDYKYDDIDIFIRDFIKRRVAKKIKIKLVIPKTQTSLRVCKNDHQILRETRFVNAGNYKLGAGEIMIYNDKTYYLSTGEKRLFGYIIHDKNITQMHRMMFESMWNSAEPIAEALEIPNLP